MTRFVAFAFLIVMGSGSLGALFESAIADDLADCERTGGDKQIQACSRIIESGLLSGKPISKKNLAAAYNNRGRAYGETGALDRAISDYNAAIRLNPDFATAYYNRGVAYGDSGEVERAIADFDNAIQRNSQYATAYNNRGIAYQFKGDLDGAIADYDMAIKLNPEYATAYNNRGDAYEKKGDLQRAAADYSKALSLDPAHKAAAYNLQNLEKQPSKESPPATAAPLEAGKPGGDTTSHQVEGSTGLDASD